MVKWEYQNVFMRHTFGGLTVPTIDGGAEGKDWDDVEEFMNMQGEQGWEMVSVFSYGGVTTQRILMVFKRQKE